MTLVKFGLLPEVEIPCSLNSRRLCSSKQHSAMSRTEQSAAAVDALPNDQFSFSSVEDFSTSTNEKPEYWLDPWRYAAGVHKDPAPVYTDFEESKSEFHWVQRLLPFDQVPDPPKHDRYPTPSGWRAPKYPPPDLPYYIRRDHYHMFPLHIECRRDRLNPQTYEFDYVEIVTMKNIEGDVFACEKDLRRYVEDRLNKKVGTHISEAQGKIRIKGVDRSLLEQFLIDCGF